MIKMRRKGQAVVELALVLPIFIVVVLGIYDFGRALHSWSNLNFQCIQAARAATLKSGKLYRVSDNYIWSYPTVNQVEEAFWKNKSPLMPKEDIDLQLQGVGENVKAVTVKATYKLELITPVLGTLLGGSDGSSNFLISASATENKER